MCCAIQAREAAGGVGQPTSVAQHYRCHNTHRRAQVSVCLVDKTRSSMQQRPSLYEPPTLRGSARGRPELLRKSVSGGIFKLRRLPPERVISPLFSQQLAVIESLASSPRPPITSTRLGNYHTGHGENWDQHIGHHAGRRPGGAEE